MGFLFFVIGSCLGSFFLVLGKRLPQNQNVINSRSKCDNCNEKLVWWQLIPILSYIFLGGKCYYCHQKIGIANLICEISLGLLFLFGYKYYGFSYNLYVYLILASLMIIIFISDFSYYIILDSPLVISGVLITLLNVIYFGYKEAILYILQGLIMFLVMYIIKLLGDLLFKKESLGGGDIKLSFIIGLALGFRLGLISLILSSFLALPYSVASLKLQKNNEVPFGPFLVSSLFIVFIFMDKFADIINLFN